MATILCVLYDDPVDGYPPEYARDEVPEDRALSGRPDDADARTALDFTPGELLGCVSGALGLRRLREDAGHELIVTSDKDGPDSELERRLPDG